MDNSKRLLFSKMDAPQTPFMEGTREFYYGVLDKDYVSRRLKCLEVTKGEIVEVAQRIVDVDSSDLLTSVSIFGNTSEETVEELQERGFAVNRALSPSPN